MGTDRPSVIGQQTCVTSAQSLRLVRILHQSWDLLHHSQSSVINAVVQFDFAPVQNHVLIVVGT